MTLSEFEGPFQYLQLRNKALFNYNMFTYKLQSTHGLWFKRRCQKWPSSQGHRQLRSLQKW